MAYRDTDVGAELLLVGTKVAPAQTGGAINGPWFDVKQAPSPFNSLTAFGALGTSAGTAPPTSQVLTLRIQDADDSSGTGAADYKPDGANVARSVTGISGLRAATDNTATQLNVNMKNSRRWARVVATYTPTGGTAPVNDVAFGAYLGGPHDAPTTPPNP